MKIIIEISDDELETFKSYIGLLPCRIEDRLKRQECLNKIKDKIKLAIINEENNTNVNLIHLHTQILLLNCLQSLSVEQNINGVTIIDLFENTMKRFDEIHYNKTHYSHFDPTMMYPVLHDLLGEKMITKEIIRNDLKEECVLYRITNKGTDYFHGLIR